MKPLATKYEEAVARNLASFKLKIARLVVRPGPDLAELKSLSVPEIKTRIGIRKMDGAFDAEVTDLYRDLSKVTVGTAGKKPAKSTAAKTAETGTKPEQAPPAPEADGPAKSPKSPKSAKGKKRPRFF